MYSTIPTHRSTIRVLWGGVGWGGGGILRASEPEEGEIFACIYSLMRKTFRE